MIVLMIGGRWGGGDDRLNGCSRGTEPVKENVEKRYKNPAKCMALTDRDLIFPASDPNRKIY